MAQRLRRVLQRVWKGALALFSFVGLSRDLQFQAKVERMRKQLRDRVVQVGLSERELAILATAVCDMQARGVDPLKASTVIQVDAW